MNECRTIANAVTLHVSKKYKVKIVPYYIYSSIDCVDLSKFSCHVVFNGMKIMQCSVRQLITTACKTIKHPEYIDYGVYGNHSLRCYLSCKHMKNNRLSNLTIGDDPFIITTTMEPNMKMFRKTLVTVSDAKDKLIETSTKKPTKKTCINNNVKPNDVKDALSSIDPSDLSYDEWLKVGMSLYSFNNSYEMLNEWDEWSQSDESRYLPDVCEQKWKSFNANSGITIATLFYYSKR